MSGDWWPSFVATEGATSPPPDVAVLSPAQIDDLRGRLLLIGVTEWREEGPRHFQTYGRVVDVDPARGVSIDCLGAHMGRTFTVPPDRRAFQPASPGSYRLRSTGETVLDPDFLATFDLKPPGSRIAPAQETQP